MFSWHAILIVLHVHPLPHNAALVTMENIWIKLQRHVGQVVHLDTLLIAPTAYAHSAVLDVLLVPQHYFALYVM